ncbi:hypothetical protein FCL40_01080 [Ferrimonas sediminicola]|uniref:Class IIb bacteriocin, lactobin A/cerein 7B family n=1 Tax=Ferrimonas sediminicola TaxID=2569538 RepID=A0A4U1BIB4_9GAMM|nr:hypothetical protein [Ferrimonas sediminicola]TKB51180.1 hypothetical protein FCL40_01080 [Ferrimonas sediminicola]
MQSLTSKEMQQVTGGEFSDWVAAAAVAVVSTFSGGASVVAGLAVKEVLSDTEATGRILYNNPCTPKF